MAKFDISYVIKAIDEFSPAAKEVAKSAKQMQKAVSQAAREAEKISKSPLKNTQQASMSMKDLAKSVMNAQKSFKLFNKEEKKSHLKSDVAAGAKAAEKMAKSLDPSLHKTKVLGRHLRKVTNEVKKSKHSFSEFSDYFATSAYYRLMNVGLPIMGVSIPAIKLLSQVQSSSAALKMMVSNFKELNEQAEKLSQSSAFTRTDFLVVDRKLASMGLSGKGIKDSMQGIAAYASATGQSLEQAAQAVGAAATGQKRVGTTDVMALGGTAATRFVRDSIALSKKFHGIAMAQFSTSTQQMAKALDSINESIAQIISVVSGPVTSLLKSVAKVVKLISTWAKDNKALAKTIGSVLAGVAAFLAAGVALGSVIGIASFAVTGVSAALTALTAVFGVASWAVRGLSVAIGGLDFAMLLNPIGLLIAALAALSAAVYEAVKHWGQLKCAILKVYYVVKNKVIAVFKSLKSEISSLLSPIDAIYSKMKKMGDIGISWYHKVSVPTMNSGQAGGMKHQTTIGQQEKSQSSHKVEISVKGTNAEVSGAHVISDDASMAPILNLGKNYSGGY